MSTSRFPDIPGGGQGPYNRMAAQPLWDTWSNQLFPINLEKAFYYARWLRMRNGDLVAAIRRGICYFLNGIEITSDIEDLDSKDHYTDLLEKQHKLLHQVLSASLDLQFYGNSFTTVFPPISRTLRCPRCGATRYLRSLQRGRDYDYTNGEFTTTCGCGNHGVFPYVDYIDGNSQRPLNVVSLSPMSVGIDHCAITQAEKITYYPSKADRSFIDNAAESTSLETLPRALLEVLTNDEALEFHPGNCLHLALPSDSMGADEMKGWGLPAFLPSFKYVVMLMLLERQTEAAVKDYILPIRLLFPDPSSSRGGSDPMAMATNVLHMGAFRNDVENALKSQAYQQSSWQMIPAPVQQLTLGGDGKAVVPVELMQFAKEQLLDSLCIPTEFYKSSILSGQAPPLALRMFEQTWEREVNLMDDYINWYLRQCKQLLKWPAMEGALMRQSVSSDPNRMNMLMGLAQEGKISQTTLMRSLSINPRQERGRIVEDELNNAKLQQSISMRLNKAGMMSDMFMQSAGQNMEQAMMAAQGGGAGGDPAQQGGAMPPGDPMAAPAGGAGMQTGNPQMDIQNLPTVRSPQTATPDQLQADAQTVAMYLMKTPIGSQRNQIYSMVKQLNPTLYDISKSILQKMENQAKQQGVEQARQG